MLQQLRLENFRCFKDHSISFGPLSILVGRNNAGKSTIVDALRLVSIVTNRYRSSNYQEVPAWLDAPKRERGIAPSLRGMQFNLDTIFHRYADPPAMVTATFDSRESTKIYIGPEPAIHAVLFDSGGHPVPSRFEANALTFPQVNILPQISPLLREEELLDPDYVKAAMSSSLASLHFRNELFRDFASCIEQFRELAAATWPSLQVRDLEIKSDPPDPKRILYLYVRDGDFVAEVGRMGHGLQMWLQTMWFLARVDPSSSIVLDEPDVYMHADLQRKLIRLVRGRYRQTVIATHSVEIMSEVPPNEVVVVDHHRNRSVSANSLPAVQRIVDSIGGVHNLQLTRLWSSRKCLFVEGDDLSFLKRFQDLLFPESEQPLDAVPNMAIGGWGGWNLAVGSSALLKNSGGQKIRAYCILDSDYHTRKEIKARLKEAKERGIELHIWSRKEIENYVLVPSAIQAALRSEVGQGAAFPSLPEVLSALEKIAEELKDETTDKIAETLFTKREVKGIQDAIKEARKLVNGRWSSLEDRLGIVSGKRVIALLSDWSQSNSGVGLGTSKIIKAMKEADVPSEIKTLLTTIEKGKAIA
ncbi:ATP-dependent nuclease [Candidatus Binatus sp.]|jgi:hypothetical protein|uniref:ATP-dependent nuclease n=1 Tax=Candidatus Binatus sp. TaxID=2811406 RepID=UPI003BBEBE07